MDRALSTMSAFDLIDYCSQLFEKLVKLRGTQRGLRQYVRAYLIFSYFITVFILVHFEGFARFMENNHADFVIYLNLYDFFGSDNVLALDAFSISLKEARQHVLEYLALKELLTFDAEELFGWLDEYVVYLRDQGDDSAQNDGQQTLQLPLETGISEKRLTEVSVSKAPPSPGSVGFLEDDTSINEIDDFSSRFPEISASKYTGSTPYPVEPVIPVPLLTELSQNEASSETRTSRRFSLSLLESKETPLHALESMEPPLLAPPPVPRHEVRTYSNGSSNGPSRALPPVPSMAPVPSSRTYPTDPDGFLPPTNGMINGYSEQNMNPPRLSLQTRSLTQMDQNTRSYPPARAPQGLSDSWQDPNQKHGVPQYSVPQLRMYNSHGIPPQVPRSYGDQQRQVAQPPSRTQPYSMVAAAHRPSSNGDNRISKTQWMHANAVCGLKNLGSSCYINLTIQILVGLERFSDLFYYRTREWLTSNKKNTLAESTASLVATFMSNGGANIAPTKFLKVLTRLKPDFNIPNEQQDAQEFLIFLLDRLHEDLARKPSSHTDTDYISTWDIDVNPNDREQYLEWYRGLIKHEGESQINDMCQGHVQNKLICNKCGFSSISYSPFTILSLPIPHTNKEGVDLTDCLRYYTQDEVLSGENAWKCPKCNKTEDTKENPMDVVFEQKRGLFRFSKRSKSPSKKTLSTTVANASTISIKQLSFIKLPPVLFIHLSRFHMFNLTNKLDTDIAYPLRLLFNRNDHEITYVLRGLVNHYGNLNGGHYTSIVKKSPRMAADDTSPPVWCSFDDDHVRINVPYGNQGVSANKVHSRDVYVLCYERV